MSSSITGGENWFSRLSGLAGRSPAAPVKEASAPAAEPAQATVKVGHQDQMMLSSSGHAASRLNALVPSLPSVDLAMVKGAPSEEKLIQQLVAREFPGLKLSDAQMKGLLSFVQNDLRAKGLDLAEIQKGLKAQG